MLKSLAKQLSESVCLSDKQVCQAVDHLVDEAELAEAKAEFLTALARKGETLAEILAFTRELRARAVQPALSPVLRAGPLLDVCGTGGDNLGTFNISTTVAIIVASAGVPVAKHGNRAITSQCGSADVLEALGMRVEFSPKEAAEGLEEHQFAFFFAPIYHPAFRNIGPARRLCAQRGQRTVFNFLGPLLNPAAPNVQLVGVPNPDLCPELARVLQGMGLRRGMVVSGAIETKEGGKPACMDELSILGSNAVAEFSGKNPISTSRLALGMFPIQPCRFEDLCGADSVANAATLRRIVRGEERGPKRDAVLLNAGAALYLCEEVGSMPEGWAFAGELIDSGEAARKLDELVAAFPKV